MKIAIYEADHVGNGNMHRTGHKKHSSNRRPSFLSMLLAKIESLATVIKSTTVTAIHKGNRYLTGYLPSQVVVVESASAPIPGHEPIAALPHARSESEPSLSVARSRDTQDEPARRYLSRYTLFRLSTHRSRTSFLARADGRYQTPCQSVNEVLPWIEESKQYVRVSEIVEVDIRLLPEDSLIAAKLESLDEKEATLRNSFQEKLNAIEFERGKLLALTHKA